MKHREDVLTWMAIVVIGLVVIGIAHIKVQDTNLNLCEQAIFKAFPTIRFDDGTFEGYALGMKNCSDQNSFWRF